MLMIAAKARLSTSLGLSDASLLVDVVTVPARLLVVLAFVVDVSVNAAPIDTA